MDEEEGTKADSKDHATTSAIDHSAPSPQEADTQGRVAEKGRKEKDQEREKEGKGFEEESMASSFKTFCSEGGEGMVAPLFLVDIVCTIPCERAIRTSCLELPEENRVLCH